MDIQNKKKKKKLFTITVTEFSQKLFLFFVTLQKNIMWRLASVYVWINQPCH